MYHVYHWKHGWIPLDHVAAMKKAKGNEKSASQYLAASHAAGHAHSSVVDGRHHAGAGTHMLGAQGWQPVHQDHLPRRDHIVAAFHPGARQFAVLDTESGATHTLSEAEAYLVHANGHQIGRVLSGGRGILAEPKTRHTPIPQVPKVKAPRQAAPKGLPAGWSKVDDHSALDPKDHTWKRPIEAAASRYGEGSAEHQRAVERFTPAGGVFQHANGDTLTVESSRAGAANVHKLLASLGKAHDATRTALPQKIHVRLASGERRPRTLAYVRGGGMLNFGGDTDKITVLPAALKYSGDQQGWHSHGNHEDPLTHTLVHEMGHLHHNTMGRDRVGHGLWKATAADGPRYGRESKFEGYAEAFAHHHLGYSDNGHMHDQVARKYAMVYGWK